MIGDVLAALLGFGIGRRVKLTRVGVAGDLPLLFLAEEDHAHFVGGMVSGGRGALEEKLASAHPVIEADGGLSRFPELKGGVHGKARTIGARSRRRRFRLRRRAGVLVLRPGYAAPPACGAEEKREDPARMSPTGAR